MRVSVRARTCGELGEHVQCDGARLELWRVRVRVGARARLQQQVPLRAAQVHAAGLRRDSCGSFAQKY